MTNCKAFKPIDDHRLHISDSTSVHASVKWFQKMKLTILLSVLSAFLVSCGSHTASSLDPIVWRAKETSLYSDRVNWEEIDREFQKQVGSRQTAEDLKPGLTYLINSLGDKHGTIRSTSDFSAIAWFTGTPDSLHDSWDADFLETVIHDTSAKFDYSLTHGDVGYLRVVGIGPGDVNEQARLILDGLRKLKALGVDKWILDLRFNGGGNMNPMIAGLAPLIGNGFIGGSVNSKGTLIHRYEITDGTFYDTGRQVSELDSRPCIGSNEKIAVLLSRYTISSGELVAIALKGRGNTLFIGERTAGYTTGTGYQEIGEGLVMVISESVFVDRNMTQYPNGVSPDEESEFDPTQSGFEDLQLTFALQWLRE